MGAALEYGRGLVGLSTASREYRFPVRARCAAPDTWRRLVAHMLRSFATPDAPLPPLPDAPAPTALYRAMVGITRHGR
ncbi:hypothetical protein [Streptomyces sp. NPDC048106]|uniref:hypothetical protein n=1 Tax=Streptomyces sp. NPDC048106 TaxID=3155750 RepID=UPI003455BEAA